MNINTNYSMNQPSNNKPSNNISMGRKPKPSDVIQLLEALGSGKFVEKSRFDRVLKKESIGDNKKALQALAKMDTFIRRGISEDSHVRYRLGLPKDLPSNPDKLQKALDKNNVFSVLKNRIKKVYGSIIVNTRLERNKKGELVRVSRNLTDGIAMDVRPVSEKVKK